MVASAVFWSELKAGAKVIKCISRTCLASWKWDRRLFSATNYSSNDTVLKLELSLSTQKQKNDTFRFVQFWRKTGNFSLKKSMLISYWFFVFVV